LFIKDLSCFFAICHALEFKTQLLFRYKIEFIGWADGPWALVTPVKAIRVGVGL